MVQLDHLLWNGRRFISFPFTSISSKNVCNFIANLEIVIQHLEEKGMVVMEECKTKFLSGFSTISENHLALIPPFGQYDMYQFLMGVDSVICNNLSLPVFGLAPNIIIT